MVAPHEHDWFTLDDPPWPILVGFRCAGCGEEKQATDWEKALWHDAYAIGWSTSHDYYKRGPRPGTPAG